jgi:ferredoxin--NADP+ reductase
VTVTDGMSPTAQRNLQLLREYAQREPSGKSHRIELRFLRSPVEVLGDGAAGRVRGLRVVRNRLDDNLRAVSTSEEEVIPCGLVVRSIGYRGRPLPGVPFDEARGLIRNAGGRVTGDDGQALRGEYAVGWIKRGPSGVIGTNKKDSAETTTRIVADADAGVLNEPAGDTSADAVEAWLCAVVPGLVTWAGWRAIDAKETSAGAAQGRPRVKVVRVPDMLALARP